MGILDCKTRIKVGVEVNSSLGIDVGTIEGSSDPRLGSIDGACIGFSVGDSVG